MTDMVERVARAILVVARPNGGGDWRDLRPAALAAIKAMREPTPEMMRALKFYGMLDGDAEEAWEKTLETALDPSTPLVGS